MTWLVWRQYRAQAAIAGALLAAFALVLLVTGTQMASQWHTALSACTADRSCGSLVNSLSLGNHAVYDLTIFSLIVPGVIGLLIGAPLVAGEVETGTSNFAWTQSITRSRWLLAKAGWLLLAAAVWGGCVAALVTWWAGPRNALYGNALQPNDFDMQGIVPVAYALFAMPSAIPNGRGAPMGHLGSCIASAGFRQFISYQPISRYWAFQSIETAIFLALAAALVALAFAVVRRRDA
jgi:hypothetical protein